MKCRVSESDHTKLKMTELSMQVENIMGAHVNGRNNLLILERSLYYRRSLKKNKISKSCEKYMREQRALKEQQIRKEGRLDAFFVLTGIITITSLWSLILWYLWWIVWTPFSEKNRKYKSAKHVKIKNGNFTLNSCTITHFSMNLKTWT